MNIEENLKTFMSRVNKSSLILADPFSNGNESKWTLVYQNLTASYTIKSENKLNKFVS